MSTVEAIVERERRYLLQTYNSTQDTVLRFLPPYLLEEKHVEKGIKVLRKILAKQKTGASQISAAAK